MPEDTIAALATPLGEGGLAVIRLSGAQALAIADRVFRPAGKGSSRPSAAPSHTLHYGHVVRHGAVVDEALLAVMRAPRTYTREDTVEISCHGGVLVAKLVLDTVLEQGARLAEPGEFTRRAFLNGRLDLAQAEAVADLIHARTELAVAAANEQLAGKLSQRVRQLREQLLHALAHVEAHIDFPDEDIAPDTRDQLVTRLEHALAFVAELLRTAPEGQILRRGIRAAIIGRPNVGKSSLLNLLLGHDRAIVSPTPGTTRDTIAETANIRGLPVVFIDTAGLREATDAVEQEGIRRSRQTWADAELILHVLDASQPLTSAEAQDLAEFAGKPRILVLNKSDLPRCLQLPAEIADGAGAGRGLAGEGVEASRALTSAATERVVAISCLTGQGLEQLKDAIKDAVWSGDIRAEHLQVMINARHQDALRRAQDALHRALEGLQQDLTLELVALDLRLAAEAVGEITGQTVTEDLLDSIFSQFCIGK